MIALSSRLSVVICGASLIAALSCAHAFPVNRDIPIALQVTSSARRLIRPTLEIAISNSRATSIKLYSADLPWATRHSLLLVAMTNDSQQSRIDEALYVDDPGPGYTVIGPKDTKTGSIDLTRRFPDLSKVRRESEVIIFWSYQAKLVTGEQTRRVSGAVVLPKLE